jgi:hypothetical protein
MRITRVDPSCRARGPRQHKRNYDGKRRQSTTRKFRGDRPKIDGCSVIAITADAVGRGSVGQRRQLKLDTARDYFFLSSMM